MSTLTTDKFARLKALHGPASAARRSPPRQQPQAIAGSLAAEDDEPRGMRPDLPAGAERLAEILGARPSRNQFGEHLALRRWFSESIGCEAPSGPVDSAALRLLAPDAPRERQRSTAVAFPRHRDHRACRRHRNLPLPGRHRVVGRRRAGSGAVFHARAQRGAFGAGGARGAHGRAPRARHIQRKIVRLAAAGNALPHDPQDSTCLPRGRISTFCIRRATCGVCGLDRCGCRSWNGTFSDGIAART